jgi:hypothetical protein
VLSPPPCFTQGAGGNGALIKIANIAKTMSRKFSRALTGKGSMPYRAHEEERHHHVRPAPMPPLLSVAPIVPYVPACVTPKLLPRCLFPNT